MPHEKIVKPAKIKRPKHWTPRYWLYVVRPKRKTAVVCFALGTVRQVMTKWEMMMNDAISDPVPDNRPMQQTLVEHGLYYTTTKWDEYETRESAEAALENLKRRPRTNVMLMNCMDITFDTEEESIKW
jgi:hypothetical protein